MTRLAEMQDGLCGPPAGLKRCHSLSRAVLPPQSAASRQRAQRPCLELGHDWPPPSDGFAQRAMARRGAVRRSPAHRRILAGGQIILSVGAPLGARDDWRAPTSRGSPPRQPSTPRAIRSRGARVQELAAEAEARRAQPCGYTAADTGLKA